MTNVAKLDQQKRTAPTEAGASRDAVGAIVDSIVSAAIREINAAHRSLADTEETLLQHSARVKAELEHFVTTVEFLNTDTRERVAHIERIKASHARLVNAQVANTGTD